MTELSFRAMYSLLTFPQLQNAAGSQNIIDFKPEKNLVAYTCIVKNTPFFFN